MKIKKLNNLKWLIFAFITICESGHFVTGSTYNNFNHRYSTGISKTNNDLQYRKERLSSQLRKARSSPNQQANLTNQLSASASSLHKVTFLPEDSFEPVKKYNGNNHHHHHSKQNHHYGSNKHHNSNIKRDLSEPIGFLNAVANDHATSSTNQETDTVRYPPSKTYKTTSSSSSTSDLQPQSFSRRQRDFSESPLNPSSAASETNDSMNGDEHESDSGSPFSSSGSNSGSSSSGSSSHDDSPVDSNEDFPSSHSSGSSSSSGSGNSNSGSSNSNLDDEPAAPYNDGFGASSADDDHHTRSNSLDEDEQSHHSSHSGSAPPSTPNRPPASLPSYSSTGPYLSPFGPPLPPMSGSPYRNIYSPAGPPPPQMSFPGYRPITSPLNYPALLSSASNSPMAGSSYKTMSSESYGSGSSKYRFNPAGSSSFSPSEENSQSMFNSPFSFADSFPSSSDTFGTSPTGANFGFKSSPSYSLASSDLMGLNNNWYLNQQQYLPLMMKQAGYPMMAGGNSGYGMQYQTTTQAPEQDTTKEKDKETGGKKNRFKLNFNRLQAIRLNNLKFPSLFNWHKNSTTTTPSSI